MNDTVDVPFWSRTVKQSLEFDDPRGQSSVRAASASDILGFGTFFYLRSDLRSELFIV